MRDRLVQGKRELVNGNKRGRRSSAFYGVGLNRACVRPETRTSFANLRVSRLQARLERDRLFVRTKWVEVPHGNADVDKGDDRRAQSISTRVLELIPIRVREFPRSFDVMLQRSRASSLQRYSSSCVNADERGRRSKNHARYDVAALPMERRVDCRDSEFDSDQVEARTCSSEQEF
ncbi:hypothetical protein HN011_010618 [Eciton burchellii]|nr:hypothetical protein HN011_010618 [Eciton burchellii]